MKNPLIALTGAPQSGKSELGPLIDGLENVQYFNLNQRGYKLRRKGSEHRYFYDSVVPDCIHDNGRFRAEYYMTIMQNRRLIDQILEFEVPKIQAYAEEIITDQTEGDIIVASWEYWPMIFKKVTPDHVMYLHCTDQSKWYEKLRKRAKDRGYVGPPIPDAVLNQMMSAAKYDPNGMLSDIQSSIPPERLTIIDTSPDDWNQGAVMKAARKLSTKLLNPFVP